ncbi:MAG: hypothetical protein AMJ75_01800 [Phycisphaerae bacterium SM1_79]|nr:MAG: hypothetical protein AMJ75_01800 [Phycisphaerae bacterium SM1_79]
MGGLGAICQCDGRYQRPEEAQQVSLGPGLEARDGAKSSISICLSYLYNATPLQARNYGKIGNFDGFELDVSAG